MGEFITVTEFAEKCGDDLATIKANIARGFLPAPETGGRWKVEKLLSFITSLKERYQKFSLALMPADKPASMPTPKAIAPSTTAPAEPEAQKNTVP